MSVSTETRGREKFKKFEWILNILSELVCVFPVSFRKILLNFFRNMNGVIGLGIRYVLLKAIAKNIGINVGIHPGVYLLNPENLEIGNNVSIHPMCYIDSAGGVTIGNDVTIAHGTTILSTTHNYNSHSIPIKDQPINLKQTVIEDNTWIASKVTILYGVTIGRGSVIGASSVITKKVSPNSIVVGIPGKKIKSR